MSLNDKFKVAILPINIADGDKAANLAAVEQGVKSQPKGTDLIVLPELFSTGYIADREVADSLAESVDGPTMQQIRILAAVNKVAICGSFISYDDVDAASGKPAVVYNRGFFMEPNGDVSFYAKRHLFVLGEESKIFTPGKSLAPVVRYRGWNLMMAICYDVRFPVWLRNVSNKYDALIIPANWPDRRASAWEKLLQSRAIENICYVVGANRSGSDEFGHYDSLSFVFDFLGRSIGVPSGDALTATLDRWELQTFRNKFPAWKDADDFKIIMG